MHKRETCTPGAIAHEDTFPYGESAVVPHQQKVEDFISDSKHTEDKINIRLQPQNRNSPSYQQQTLSALVKVINITF